jgi:hypothetical protein
MNITSLILVAIAVAACTKKPASVVPELGDRVLTVNEYIAQPKLREKVSAACGNDPGRTGLDPNCINVRRADHIASFGTSIPSMIP